MLEIQSTEEGERRRSARERAAAAEFVEALVAAVFRVPMATMRGASRGPAPAAFARQIGIYLAHTRLGHSYERAGASFGRDRTTAAHACRMVEDKRDDPQVDMLLDCLERALDQWLRGA